MIAGKILWPVDFSANAAKALPHIQSLSEKYGSEVHVLHVIDDLSHPDEPWYGDIEDGHAKELRKREKQQAKERLDQVCSRHLEDCPCFFKHVLVGNPARRIVEFAGEHQMNLIVLSSCGDGGHTEFGSVADTVIKNSSVPTVCVPVNDDSAKVFKEEG